MKLLVTMILVFSSSVFAYDWKHVNLTTNQGNSVNLDYQLQKHGRDIVVYPLYINVYSPSLTGREAVRAVLTQKCETPHGRYFNTFVMDCKWQQTHFSVSAQNAKDMNGYPVTYSPRTRGSGGGYGEQCSHELALVINGQWQGFGSLNSVELDLER